MRAHLDGFEELDGEILTVVADEVVCGSFFAPFVRRREMYVSVK